MRRKGRHTAPTEPRFVVNDDDGAPRPAPQHAVYEEEGAYDERLARLRGDVQALLGSNAAAEVPGRPFVDATVSTADEDGVRGGLRQGGRNTGMVRHSFQISHESSSF